MLYVRHIPNIITSLNLLSGTLSIVSAWNGDLNGAAYWIVLSAVFDFADGFFARLLGAYSAIGKELDSLADVISFGLAPSTILYQLCLHSFQLSGVQDFGTFSAGWWLCLPAMLPAVFAALRLAKFNIDDRQTTSFIGLPSPAFALFVCALPFMATSGYFFAFWGSVLYVLWGIIAVFCFLMVSEVPMFALKFHSYLPGENKLRYSFLAASLALLFLFSWTGMAWVILLYVLISIITGFRGADRQIK